jgi:RNA polymerase sigma-70 factor (ECF subfamily)
MNATGRGGHLQLVGAETMSHAAWSGGEALAYADRLYNLGRRLTGNDADAEELVQETYVRALAGARTFTGGNLKAWLFKILRNTFVDLRRRSRAVLVPMAGTAEVADGDGHWAAGDDAELLRDDLELERLRRLVGEEIEAALAALSEEARTIVLLDVEGFSETEVADVLGCPVGTVKSRLSRARVLLRQKLRDYAR